MLTIPESIKTLYKTDGVKKNFRAHFPNGELADFDNANVVRESVRFTESLCSQDVFKFGLTEASVIEFETVGIGNMYGMNIECSMEIDTSSLTAAQISDIEADPGDGELVNGYYSIPLGTFRVDSCPRNHGAMTHRRVTAYSENRESAINIPSGVWSSVEVDYNALLGYMDYSYLTDQGESTFSRSSSGVGWPLLDSSGTRYSIDGIIDADDDLGPLQESDMVYSSGSLLQSSYYSANFSGFDRAAYDAFGIKVAQALTAAGLSLTYNGAGKKVFNDNEAALRTLAPVLFSGIGNYYTSKLPYSNRYYVGSKFVQTEENVQPNVLTPIIGGPGFNPGGLYQINPISQSGIYAIVKNAPGGNVTIRLRVYPSDGSTSYTQKLNLSDVSGLSENQTITIHKYALASEDGRKYTVTSVPLGKVLTGSQHADNTAQADTKNFVEKIDRYGYADLGTWQAAIGNLLEILGLFAKPSRSGGWSVFALDPLSGAAISPSDYSDLWWDEYDAEPIGTVNVTYRGEEPGEMMLAVEIGSGASVYNISDNPAFANLGGADEETIEALLSGDFATNAANVGFTPIDLEMRGLPYLEAGDAIQATAEDGSIVNSYILRREMTGVQMLVDTVEAHGGEIMESGGAE